MLSLTKSRFTGKTLIHTLFFFLLVTQIGFGQWNMQNSGTTLGLKDITFTNENKSFMFGGWGWGHGSNWDGEWTIFTTTNGGSDWDIKLTVHSLSAFYYLVNDSVGFIIHDRPWIMGDTIYKTTDFGDSWIGVTLVWGFRGGDIIFQNGTNGWIVGDRIYKTTDYGVSWYVDYTDSLEGFFLNSISLATTTIWAVGDEGAMLKYTSQTGWVKQSSVTDLRLRKVVFLDDNNGWIAGGAEWVNGFTNIFLRTTDGGLNWNAIPNIPYLIRDMQYIDSNIGWSIGYTYDYYHQGEGGILKTTDGGVTWSLHLSMTNSKLWGIHFLDANNGWAVGENGIILHTTNGGVSFVEEEQIDGIPTDYNLTQNFPNPFNPRTNIQYAVSSMQFVSLKVYDILSNEIETLVNEEKPAGTYELTWYPEQMPSGVYFYQLKAGDFISTKKMILIK